MEIEFDFVIDGAGEAVFKVGKKDQFNIVNGNLFYGVEHRIHTIKSINVLSDLYQNNEKVMIELERARVALFNDVTLPVK